jgi:hypothetical protein
MKARSIVSSCLVAGLLSCAAPASNSNSKAVITPGASTGDPWQADDAAEIKLTVGQLVRVPAAGASRYSEPDPRVALAQMSLDQSQIYISAMAVGSTELQVVFDNGTEVAYAIRVIE